MALPCRTTGSLYPTFAPARTVALTVKHPYAIALHARLPTVLRVPLKASDTLSEATTPVKLPTTQCLPPMAGLDIKKIKGGISHFDSPEPSGPGSTPPTYSTHHPPNIN